MMRLRTLLAGCAILVSFIGCSREDRNEILDRLNDAGKSLNGDTAEDVPSIVREQRRKEKVRQNKQWTPENINAHPKEYCQAQIEYIDKLSRKLGGIHHELSVLEIKTRQELEDAKIMLVHVNEFCTNAVANYKNASRSNKWPVAIAGFSLSQEQLKQKIIEAAQQIRNLSLKISKRENQKARFKKKIDIVVETERKLADTRMLTQNALRDIEINSAIGVDNGIRAALNSINASIETLDSEQDLPSVEDLARPSVETMREQEFEAIINCGT